MPNAITPLTRAATDGLARLMDGEPAPDRLNAALRHLAKWRAAVLENTLIARSGSTVLSGPFAGMAYPVRAAEGSRNARLLGCYEASLAPIFETVISRAYPMVIDIGSAEGYYATGLARRMPATTVLARDSNPAAQTLCRAMAEANHVSLRVHIGGTMDHADFSVCTAQPTFILCDIEGAEQDLLDPARGPGLLHADLLVEVHEATSPGLLTLLTARFSATHHITRIDRQLAPEVLPAWAETLSDLDRLLLLWEWRATPTPWLWMDRK